VTTNPLAVVTAASTRARFGDTGAGAAGGAAIGTYYGGPVGGAVGGQAGAKIEGWLSTPDCSPVAAGPGDCKSKVARAKIGEIRTHMYQEMLAAAGGPGAPEIVISAVNNAWEKIDGCITSRLYADCAAQGFTDDEPSSSTPGPTGRPTAFVAGDIAKKPMSTPAKVAIGVGATGVAVGIGWAVWKFLL